MDWKWLLGDAEFYVGMALKAVVFVFSVALVFYCIERVLTKYGLWDPTPPNKRVKQSR